MKRLSVSTGHLGARGVQKSFKGTAQHSDNKMVTDVAGKTVCKCRALVIDSMSFDAVDCTMSLVDAKVTRFHDGLEWMKVDIKKTEIMKICNNKTLWTNDCRMRSKGGALAKIPHCKV